MKYVKRILILTLVMLTLVSMASVCASDVNDTAIASDNTDQVIEEIDIDDNLAICEDEAIAQKDNDEVLSMDDGTFTELQNKINNAASGSTITLEHDYTYDDGFNSNGITINITELTIDGNGHTLNGLSKSRILYMLHGDIILKNIKFVNGYTTEDGGAIFCNYVLYKSPNIYTHPKYIRLEISNCIFENNHANQGGAI